MGITITICYLGLSNLYGSMTMEHNCSFPSNNLSKFYIPGTKHTELCMRGLSTGPLSQVETVHEGNSD